MSDWIEALNTALNILIGIALSVLMLVLSLPSFVQDFQRGESHTAE